MTSPTSTTRRLPRLRHDAARRRPARGHLLLRVRQARRGAAARRARRRVHRGRLARRPAQGHRVLRPGPRRARPAARPARRLRVDAQGGRARARTTRRCRRCSTPGRPVVTLVAKSDLRHVREALRTTPEENLAMVRDTVAPPRRGTVGGCSSTASTSSTATPHDPDYGVELLRVAAEAGHVGGRAVRHQRRHAAEPASARSSPTSWSAAASGSGIHCQDDTACAVANTIAAVEAGATHVQCTANGYGERTGNADLFAVVGNLETKLDMRVLPEGKLAEMVRVSHALADIANLPPDTHQAYVGVSAFAHKAGLHASALKVERRRSTTTWTPRWSATTCGCWSPRWPGRASVELKGRELGIDLSGDGAVLGRVVERVKDLESSGLDVRGGRRVVRAAAARRDGRRASVGTSRSSRGARSSSRAPDGTRGQRGDGEGARRRRAHHLHRGGQRPGQRARQRAARGAHRGVPGAGPARARRLQGPHPRRRAPAPTRSPACSSGPPTARASGPPSACTRTSSRPRGSRWRTRSPTACSRPGARRRRRAATD